MHYQESQLILDKINKANKILLNCHRGPDSDSIGSATALSNVLIAMGKSVLIVCPSDIVPEFGYIEGSENIAKIDFSTFNFSDYDLFITTDSSTWGQISGDKDLLLPKVPIVVIDHHKSNTNYGEINLVDSKITSTCELLYFVFEDWKVQIDSSTANSLLTGIIGDTGAFQYPGVGRTTLQVAGDLMDKGADKDMIIQNIYRNVEFNEVKLWGEMINGMVFEKEHKFIWSAVDNEVFKKHGEHAYAKEDAANLLFPIVRDTDFGIIMVETKKEVLSVSFRSRNNFDVSKIAEDLGGGGHKMAAGARIEGHSFSDAVNKVLEAAKKHAKKVS